MGEEKITSSLEELIAEEERLKEHLSNLKDQFKGKDNNSVHEASETAEKALKKVQLMIRMKEKQRNQQG